MDIWFLTRSWLTADRMSYNLAALSKYEKAKDDGQLISHLQENETKHV